jgi:type IV pilus secretin PilQ/predicted competence protein
MRPAARTLVVAMLLLGLATAVRPGRSAEPPLAHLDAVSVAAEGESVVVRLKTSARRYETDLIDHPYRLIVDLPDTIYAWQKRPLVVPAGPLLQIRGSQYRKGVARVVLELKAAVPYWVQTEDDALVVVLGAPRPKQTRVAPAPPPLAAVATQPSPIAVRPEGTAQAPVVVAQAAPPPPPAATPPSPEPSAPVVTQPATPPPAPVPPPVATAPVPGERLISLEFKDADVVNLLRILAAESGRNIVMGDDVKGKMSISLRNVPWTLALQTILETRGLQRVDRDGVIRIVSTEQLTKEREAQARVEEAKVKAEVDIRTKRAEAELKEREIRLKDQETEQRKRAAEAATAEAIARGPLTEVAIRLAYADPGEVAGTLSGLLGLGQSGAVIMPCRKVNQEKGKREVKFGTGGGVIESPTRGPIAEPPFSQLFGPPPQEGRPAPPPPPEEVTSRRRAVQAHCATNTLFLRLHATDLERIRKLIREALDVPVPQVKIEARLEVLDRNDLFALGVQWGGGGVLAVDNKNVIVGRGFTSDPVTNPIAGGIPAAGLGALSNPNLLIGSPGGTVIPVSAQNGLPLGGNLVNLPISALLNNAAATGGAAGLTFGIIGSKLNLNLTLEALRTQGKTFSLARPDVVTLENNMARISLGEEIPYATVSSAGTQIQFKEALLQLSVIPTVVREVNRTRIHMSVMVENNSRGTVVNLGGSGAPPAINRRSAETDVIITEGDHLVIGGIMTSIQQEEVRKLPLLGDVPLFGWLFKQRGTKDTRSELVVFITPMVLNSDRPTAPAPPPPAPLPVRPQPPAK